MSYADKVFIDMCRDIIDNGTRYQREKRSVRNGRMGRRAYTIKKIWSGEPL